MSIEHKYLYNGTLVTLDELHAAGVLLGTSQPTEATVYDVEDGTVGTRYTSAADGIIVKSEGDIHYYATQDACDADWTTEEPSSEFTAYLKADKTADSLQQYKVSGTAESVIGSYPTGTGSNYLDLYDENGAKIPYDASKTYTATSAMNSDGTYESTLEIYNSVGFNNCQSGYSEAIYYLVNHNGYLAWNGVTAKNGESLPYTLNIYILWIKYTAT